MFASTILLFMCVSASMAVNEIKLGSAIDFPIKEDSPKCSFKVEVPEARAGDNCKLLVNTFSSSTVKPTPQLNFYWKHGSDDFAAADKQPHMAGSDLEKAVVACKKAGTYFLGADVNDCTGCGASEFVGNDPAARVGVVLQDGKDFVIDIGKATEFITPPLDMLEDNKVTFHFETEAANHVAHFDIDKSFTSGADNYDYFWGAAGATGNGTEVSSSATNEVLLDQLETAGKYWLRVAIKNGLTGVSSKFKAQYKLNAEASDVDYPEGTCPLEKCNLNELQSCGDCKEAGCSWCPETATCTNRAVCDKGEQLGAGDKCADLKCDSKETCTACAGVAGCQWCDSVGDTIGLGSSGSCSEGAKCKSKLADSVTDPDQCDGASVVSLAVAAVVGALALAF